VATPAERSVKCFDISRNYFMHAWISLAEPRGAYYCFKPYGIAIIQHLKSIQEKP
jgi:hypothetical protein